MTTCSLRHFCFFSPKIKICFACVTFKRNFCNAKPKYLQLFNILLLIKRKHFLMSLSSSSSFHSYNYYRSQSSFMAKAEVLLVNDILLLLDFLQEAERQRDKERKNKCYNIVIIIDVFLFVFLVPLSDNASSSFSLMQYV